MFPSLKRGYATSPEGNCFDDLLWNEVYNWSFGFVTTWFKSERPKRFHFAQQTVLWRSV